MQLRHNTPLLLLGTALSLLSAAASASPIPAGISVTTQAYLDTVNSSAGSNAFQSGQIGIISNGSTTSQTFNDISIGTNPLTGNASMTGDGSFLSFDLAGRSNDAGNAQNDGLFGDLFLNVSNNSGAGYKAKFAIDVAYSSVFSSGPDAFVKFDFSLQDSTLNEVFFSSIMRDTINGDSDSASASNILEILLNPGDTASFHGIEKAYGGAFIPRSSYAGSVSVTLRIVDFTPLPEPSSLLLAGLGLGLLFGKRRFF